MKKTHILFAALFSSLALISCNFDELQAPKEIKVRTDATYEFSVMSFDSEKEGSKLKLSDYFDLSKTLEEKTAGANEGTQVFKYNSGSTFQEFLIHMPLDEVEVDLTETLNKMDFSAASQKFDIDKEIPIPDVGALNDSQDLDLSSIMQTLNTAVTFDGDTSTTGSTATIFPAPFTEMLYSSGKLIVEAASNVIGTMSLKYNGQTITSGSFNDTIAELPLTNVTLYSSGMTIVYSGSTPESIHFDANIDSSSVIHTAKGVNLPSSAFTVPPTEVSFDVDLDDTLKEVKIVEGKLFVEINNPDSWSENVIGNYTITVSDAIDPSLTIHKGDTTDGNLNNKFLKEGQIKAVADVPINIEGGKTIVFADPPKVTVKTDIKKITAEVEMSDDFDTTVNEEIDPGNDLKEYVTSITWKKNGAGFLVTANNNLPSNDNNKMELTLSSTKLQVNPSEPAIIEPGKNQSFLFVNDDEFTTPIEASTKFDVIGTLSLTEGSHSTPAKKTVIISDVKPGETYIISLKIEPVLDWKEAEVLLPAEKTNFKGEMDTGMNKTSLFSVFGEDFAKNVNIRKMPYYIYANFPSQLANGKKLNGYIKAIYGTADGAGKLNPITPVIETYLLPEGSEIDTNSDFPEFQFNDAGEIINKFEDTENSLAPAMNLVSNEGTLWIDYDIKLGDGSAASSTVTIKSDEMEPLRQQGKSNVKIDIIVLFPLDFTVVNPVDIDMLSFANKKDGDLLGRSEATESSKYLDVIKSATISIEKFMLPMTGDISLSIDRKGDGTDIVTKPVGNGETYSIEVNPKDMLSTYPYSPNINFRLEKGNFGILRTMPISGKIKLKVKAKGDIPIFSFSEQD